MNDYPTKEELKKIREWPVIINVPDFNKFMDFVHGIWHYVFGYWQQEGNIYHISTAGWSGNEDIIAAMQDNFVLWSMYWCQSQRGGHYIFAPCEDWITKSDNASEA